MTEDTDREELLRMPRKEIAYLILKIARLIKLFGDEVLSDIFNNYDEHILLDIINDRAGLCQKDIAQASVFETSRVSKILSTFEKQGLIKKTPAVKNNKLVNELYITSKGKKKIHEAEPRIEGMKQLADKLFPDTELIDFKNKLTDLAEILENYTQEKIKEKKCKKI